MDPKKTEPAEKLEAPKRKILNLKKHLPCVLTEHERLERGIELARTSENIGIEELRQKDLKDEMKSRLSALEGEAGRLASIVRRNEEYRDVDVEEIYDYETKYVYQVRKDTGEQIHRREMTASEMQEALPLEADDPDTVPGL